jgi:hypothetical protein
MKPIYLEAGDTGLRQMNATFLESPTGRRACEIGMKAIFLERTARRPRRFPDKSGSSRLGRPQRPRMNGIYLEISAALSWQASRPTP